MTSSRRWRQTNRPQTPRNSLLRRDFCGNRSKQKVKKIAWRFERSARVLRLINVGAVIPPHRLYSARAPIHPKRPYSLTRPVVPPDGSFIFGTRFLEEAAPLAVRKPLATRFSFACVMHNFTVCALERSHRHVLRNAVTLLCGLTVDRADNSVFTRVSAIVACFRSFTH
jgi:hypothetical protein